MNEPFTQNDAMIPPGMIQESRESSSDVASASPVPKRAGEGAGAGILPGLCILLAGGLKPTPIIAATGISPLDLYLTPERTLLEYWMQRLDAIGTRQTPIEVRVVHGQHCPMSGPPLPENSPDSVIVRMLPEPRPYRGPAGVVRDVFGQQPTEGVVLVSEAARWPGVELGSILRTHAESEASVTVGVNPDGSPAGLYVIAPAALELVHADGFMDLKEQWLLRAVNSGLNIRVHRFSAPGLTQLWSRTQFLAAVASVADTGRNGFCDPDRVGSGVVQDPTSLQARFAVIAPGAHVAASAHVHDSVVMPGARIGDDAVVVRSIVSPGASVEPGAEIVDCVVSSTRGIVRDQREDSRQLWKYGR